MNKNKLMNQLMDIRELTGGADSLDTDLKDDLMAIRNISSNSIKELNSKPVMPKVFDDWYKRGMELKSVYRTRMADHYAALSLAYVNSDYINDGSVTDKLAFWINQDPNKLLKCIDAIRYGYEVEK